ncbi:MAG: hypothetical protein KDA44_03685 [Planctomycetales bacterium]|nr:hypothetical protein [Planctomycetales bacterium]
MKPRFSLKLLMIGVTTMALVCFWRTRPAANAKQFAAMIEAGDFAGADQLLQEIQQPPRTNAVHAQVPQTFVEWHEKLPWLTATVDVDQQSLGNWIAGRCTGVIKVNVDGSQGAASLTATGGGVTIGPFRVVAVDLRSTTTVAR